MAAGTGMADKIGCHGTGFTEPGHAPGAGIALWLWPMVLFFARQALQRMGCV